MCPIHKTDSFLPLTFYQNVGRLLQVSSLILIRPIEYLQIESSMRNFSTAIIPGKFGNQTSAWAEASVRVGRFTLSLLSLPITLPLYAIGQVLDLVGDTLCKKPYYYLKGEFKEKNDLATKKSITIFSANLCMLPLGIFTLGGVRPPAERMDAAAQAIVTANQDFVCLQEMSFSSSLPLWEKIKASYAHGFTRIGPMPASRMESALFFASKYPIEEVHYHKLTYTGAIVRGVFCVKTEKGWILNSHLSAGSDAADERALQIKEIATLCEELSLGGKIPCFISLDSNITRTGKEQDEYVSSKIEDYFTKGIKEEAFVLTPETATYTYCLTTAIQGKEDPEDVEKAFEHVDLALAYKPSSATSKVITKMVPGFNLKSRETALTDHNILLSEIVF